MKNFNRQTFNIATILFVLLLIPSFLAALAEDEGTLGTNIVWVTFSKLFYIIRFPTHTLWWDFFSGSSAIIYFAGLLGNCLLYGLITERLISFVRRKPLIAEN
ncbi:MAG: hypothetical protein QM802_24500 [Agriterribacter sp.]